jgi:GTP-binding protein HflX
VLAEIGADAIPQVLVLNKIDRTRMRPAVERDPCGRIARIWMSAATGEGVEFARLALEEFSGSARPHAEADTTAAA